MKLLPKLIVITSLAVAGLLQPAFAQTTGPDIAWRYHDIPPQVVEGVMIVEVPGPALNPGETLTFDQSGEDWWYDIENIYEAGDHTGYMVSGFATWEGVELREGDIGACDNLNKYPFGADCNRPVPDGILLSSKLSTIARYDLNGSMVWCKAVAHSAEGAVAIAPTSDGSFIFTGWGRATRTKLGAPIHLNPTVASPLNDVAEIAGGCANLTSKMQVGKITADGVLLWLNQYTGHKAGDIVGGLELTASGVTAVSSIGYDLVERPKDSDSDPTRYLVVGQSQDRNNLNPEGKPFVKALAIELDEDGNVTDRKLLGADGAFTTARAIAVHPEGDPDSVGDDSYFITGMQIVGSTTQFVGNMDAILFKIDNNLEPASFSSYDWDGDNTAAIRYSEDDQNNIGFDVVVLEDNQIAWAFLEKCNSCTAGGNNIAKARIFLYDHITGAATAYIDLGAVNSYGFTEAHAFDLKIGLTKTSNGGFACITTVQEAPIDSSAPPYESILDNLDDLISWDCTPGEFEYHSDTDSTLHKFKTGYWNTNAYVAKFDKDGNLLWDKSFDAQAGGPEDYPGDYKEQECVYRLVEAADGSIVFVGNTSHNKDDYYLAKIFSDCSLEKDVLDGFDIEYTTAEHTYEIETSITWDFDTYDKSTVTAVGSIVVKPGATLTIDNLTVEFADSKQMPFDTRIIVEPGARLNLINGTVLTALSDCPGAMWEGVQIWGNNDLPQTSSYQGYLNMNNATIEHAVIGVATVKRNGFTKDLDYTGGILAIRDSQFRNNLIGIEMRAYQNIGFDGTVNDNVSHIRTTEFLIDALLRNPEIGYVNHVINPTNGLRETQLRAHQEFILLDQVRGVRIRGNDFTLDADYGENVKRQRKGYGILAWDAEFKVTPYAVALDEQTPNTFNNLWAGIYCKPMGSTNNVLIDGNVFTNNHYGVALEGAAHYTQITDNIFNVPENLLDTELDIEGADPAETAHVGIYTTGAKSVAIEHNRFNGVEQHSIGENTGIYIEESVFGEVYRNEFDLFDIALQTAESNNAFNVDCNTFDNDVSAGQVIAWHNAPDYVPTQGQCIGMAGTGPESPHANAFNGTYFGTNYQILNEGWPFNYVSYPEPEFAVTIHEGISAYTCDGDSYSDDETVCPVRAATAGSGGTVGIVGVATELEAAIEVLSTASQLTAAEQQQLAELQHKLDATIQWLVRTQLADGSISDAIATLSAHGSVQASAALLPLLLETRDAQQFQQQLNQVRNSAMATQQHEEAEELHAIADHYELLFQLHTQPGGLSAASVTQIAQLEALAAADNRMTSSNNNVLTYLSNGNIDELFLQPIGTNSGSTTVAPAPIDSTRKGLKMYPNPTAGKLRVEWDLSSGKSATMLTITDLTGRAVQTQQLRTATGSTTLQLNNLAPGLYQLSVNSGTERVTKKLLIAR